MAVDWLTPLLLGATNVGAGWLEYEKEARKRKEWDDDQQWRKDRATEEDRRYKEGLTREAAALARARGDRWVESLYAGTQPAAFVTEAMLKDIAEAGHFDPTHPDFDTPQERLDWARRPMANARLRYLNEVVKAHPDVATDTLMREEYGPYIERLVVTPAQPKYGDVRTHSAFGELTPQEAGIVGQLIDRKVTLLPGSTLPETVFKYRPREGETAPVYGPAKGAIAGWDSIDIGGKKKWVPADQAAVYEEKRRLEQKAEDEKVILIGVDGKPILYGGKPVRVPLESAVDYRQKAQDSERAHTLDRLKLAAMNESRTDRLQHAADVLAIRTDDLTRAGRKDIVAAMQKFIMDGETIRHRQKQAQIKLLELQGKYPEAFVPLDPKTSKQEIIPEVSQARTDAEELRRQIAADDNQYAANEALRNVYINSDPTAKALFGGLLDKGSPDLRALLGGYPAPGDGTPPPPPPSRASSPPPPSRASSPPPPSRASSPPPPSRAATTQRVRVAGAFEVLDAADLAALQQYRSRSRNAERVAVNRWDLMPAEWSAVMRGRRVRAQRRKDATAPPRKPWSQRHAPSGGKLQ